MIFTIVFYLGFLVFIIASMWKVFVKAGQPGWACLIPIYNYYIMVQIAKKPISWFLIILLVPIANIIFLIKLFHEISKAFGKDVGFTLGLIFLGFIFWPILGFGSAQYQLGDAKPGSDDLLDS